MVSHLDHVPEINQTKTTHVYVCACTHTHTQLVVEKKRKSQSTNSKKLIHSVNKKKPGKIASSEVEALG